MGSAHYIVGPPIVDPGHFYGRRAEVEGFFTSIGGSQPQSLQVLGVRRAGKTSFLRYVSHRQVIPSYLGRSDLHLIYVSLQAGIECERDFYQAIVRQLARTEPISTHLQTAALEIDTFRGFQDFLESRPLVGNHFIVLLDDFELMRDAPAFDKDFYSRLRSLADGGPVTWVIAAYRDLYRISKKLGQDEKTSPFFNIFHPVPIILGSMPPAEAEDLIRKPVVAAGIQFGLTEIAAIQNLSGRFPFFLQATAQQWVATRTPHDSMPVTELEVERSLLRDMKRHFEWYWRHATEEERICLSLAARQDSPLEKMMDNYSVSEAADDLLRYRMLELVGGQAKVTIDLFARWIRQTPPESTQSKASESLENTKSCAKESSETRQIREIRERIVQDPLRGATVLSSYLASRPNRTENLAVVDTLRAQLEEHQRTTRLGTNADAETAKTRAVHALLQICLELEQAER